MTGGTGIGRPQPERNRRREVGAALQRWINAGLLHEAVALFGLVLIPIWLFRDVILGRHLWIGSFDRLNGFLSVHLRYLQSINAEQLAAWDQSLFLGVNVIGFAHTFPNPLTLLAALWPIDLAYWVAALISCGLLAASGIGAYLFVRDSTERALPAFIGAAIYQLSASSVLRIAQNDMTFAVWLLLPIGLLFIRRLSVRPAPAMLIGLSGLLAALLMFTFLQEAAYAILLLGAFAVYRSVVTRSVLPPIVLMVALIIATVGAFPRLYTVADEFRQLNRLEARPFSQVYEFQNVRPREIARWFEDGIFGRYPSEALELGNNINLHEGLLVHSSIFATLLVVAGAVRFRGRWLGFLRTTHGDAPFHLVVLALALAIVFRPVAQAVHWLAFGVDFTHSRAAVAALPGVSILVALVLDERLRGSHLRRPRTQFLTAAAVIVGAGLLLTVIELRAEAVSVSGISTAEPIESMLQLNYDLATRGQSTAVLTSPESLVATVEQLTHIRLAWDDVVGETAYSVEMRDGDGEFQEVARPGPQATHALIENPVLGKRLAFRVRACDDRGCAAPSLETVVSIASESDFVPFDPARAPRLTSGILLASGLFDLAWEDVDGEDSYRIEHETASGVFEEVGRAAPSWTTYRLGDLGAREAHAFRVRACLREQCSGSSNVLVVRSLARSALPDDAPPVPAAPQNLEAVASSKDTIQLAWAASDGAERYRVEMRAGGSELLVIGDAVSDPPRYTVGGVAEENHHRFFVRACNPRGCSAQSNEALVTPSVTTARRLLEAPAGIVAQTVGGAYHLAWDAVPAATEYAIERRDAPDLPFVEAGRTSSLEFVDTPGDPPATAEFRVRSCNDAGCSFGSKAVNFGPTKDPPAVPAKPTLAAATDDRLRVTWEPVPNATTYRIDIRARLAAAPMRIEVDANERTTVELPVPDLGFETWADIRACTGSRCSASSPPADLAADVRWQRLPAPSSLAARATNPETLVVTWSPTPGATEYQLEMHGPKHAGYVPIGTLPGQSTTYTVGDLEPEAVYLFRVRSCREDRCSSQPALTAGVTHLMPAETALDPSYQHVTWLRAASLLELEYATAAFLVLFGLGVLIRSWSYGSSFVTLLLAALIVLDAVSSADLHLNGSQTANSPTPFADDDSFTAKPTDLRMPTAEELAVLHARLHVDESRSVLICDGKQAPLICTQHVSRFWRLRLADGSSMGTPARLAALPWPAENIGRRVVIVPSRERLPWGILGFLGVRQAVVVDVPFYLNTPRPDGRPGLDAEVVPNPGPVVPRIFFAESVAGVPDTPAAVEALFPAGDPVTTPAVVAQSIVEGLDHEAGFATDGQISTSYVGDEIAVRFEPSDGRRFLVLNELYHPRWRAYARGEEIPIYPTNVVMRGLVIEPGMDSVTLRFIPAFRPTTALLGFVLSAGLLAVAWIALRRWTRRSLDAAST